MATNRSRTSMLLVVLAGLGFMVSGCTTIVIANEAAFPARIIFSAPDRENNGMYYFDPDERRSFLSANGGSYRVCRTPDRELLEKYKRLKVTWAGILTDPSEWWRQEAAAQVQSFNARIAAEITSGDCCSGNVPFFGSVTASVWYNDVLGWRLDCESKQGDSEGNIIDFIFGDD